MSPDGDITIMTVLPVLFGRQSPFIQLRGDIIWLEVSAAKRNITPPFPMYMRGYAMRTGKSIGVLDELYCRTFSPAH